MIPLNKKPMSTKHKFNVYEGRPASNNADFNQVQHFQSKVLKSLADDTWLLENRTIAKRATSCLIQPAVGDVVVYASFDDLSCITAILQRTEQTDQVAKLSVPNQDELEVVSKKLTLMAEQEMKLMSAGDLSINASLGKLMVLSTDMVQQVKHSVIQTCKQLIARMDYSDTQAKDMLKSHSRNQIITAEKDIRVDADRINMG